VLAAGPDGALWVGTSSGIRRVRPGSRLPVLQVLNQTNGLTDRWILALAKDRAGNMWAGTEGAGAMKIQPSGFTTFREPDGLASDRVESALVDRAGTVLAVTGSEAAPGHHVVNTFDGVKFHAMSLKGFSERPPWGTSQYPATGPERRLVGGDSGGPLPLRTRQAAAKLARIQPQACYARNTGVFQIFEDSKGRIWASAQVWPSGDGRLMRWDPATKAISWFEYNPDKHLLVAPLPKTGTATSGWAPGGAGCIRYDGRQFTQFKQADGVPAGARFMIFSSITAGDCGSLPRTDSGWSITPAVRILGCGSIKPRTGWRAMRSTASPRTRRGAYTPAQGTAWTGWIRERATSNISRRPTDWRTET
jgi:hypothetical protein